jgi:Tol biopolymer transport system component
MQRGGRWDLYEFNVDSTPRFVPITNDAAVEFEPAFSPNLTQIAYVTAPADRPASLDLYVADADGSNVRRLTNDSATVAWPVFVRPNGEQIVFSSNKGGRPQLHVINRDGTGRRQLTSGEVPNIQPDVSPDGRKILFVSLRQPPGGSRNYDVWEMNLDGTGERRLTTSPRPEDTPRYAPDGRSFFYLRDEGGSPSTKRVYRQSLTDTTAAQAVTQPGTFVRTFSVSPDGSLLILTKLESVRGVGDVPQAEILNLATGATMLIHLGAGEQLAAPTFRPATPTAPTTPAAPQATPAPASPAPQAAPTVRPPQ